jgi:ATP-dependent Lon protease
MQKNQITEKEHKDEIKVIDELPVIALRGLTVFPSMTISFELTRLRSVMAADAAMTGDRRLCLVTQDDPREDCPEYSQVGHTGTIVRIREIIRPGGSTVRILVEAVSRAAVSDFTQVEPYIKAPVTVISKSTELAGLGRDAEKAMMRSLRDLYRSYYAVYKKLDKALADKLDNAGSLGEMTDILAVNLPIDFREKKKLLAALTYQERYTLISGIMANEISINQIRSELAENLKAQITKNQREYVLREQLNFIRRELGDDNSFSDEAKMEEALGRLNADEDVRGRIAEEIARFKSLGANNTEASVEREYIETLLKMPWNNSSEDNTDIRNAEKVLDSEHYGMEKVKERILETLAVRALTDRGQSQIICLIGPPGTGKTSIAQSVSEALGRKYVRISLGGVRDEAEIRGHRKTYVGAMPGRIAAGLRQAGVNNPLMLLDEIDKMSSDYRGDTASALLEVLDSDQNSHFTDHYIEIPIDLSKVMFIATANSAENIPGPLLDRMEVIEVTSYTANEKFHIAREHLIPKQLELSGLGPEMLQISDGALKLIISSYTREAGVRGLERTVGSICRKAAREIIEDGSKTVHVTAVSLPKYLGKIKYTQEKANDRDDIGIVRGLAWTSVGGCTLQIEVNVMPGKGETVLTGQMGDVMKESAMTGLSYVRSIADRYKVPQNMFQKNDIHIHIPEGAVPKDGPSAGITMAAAMLSAVTKIPVKASVAMTGEITLRGRVLPIGGLKEKLLAAKTAGIKEVLVPYDNKSDVDEISREIRDGMEIRYVKTMDEVLAEALVRKNTGGKKDTHDNKKC